MGISATKTEPWLLEYIDTALELRTLEKGDLDEDGEPVSEMTIQKRDHYIIGMRRSFYGLSSFNEECGETKTSFTFGTSAVMSLTFVSTRKKYKCSKDSVIIKDPITGAGEQQQTWEHYTLWENCDPDEFSS